jgi:hypothetical protein
MSEWWISFFKDLESFGAFCKGNEHHQYVSVTTTVVCEFHMYWDLLLLLVWKSYIHINNLVLYSDLKVPQSLGKIRNDRKT